MTSSSSNYYKIIFVADGEKKWRKPQYFPFDYRNEGTAYKQAMAIVEEMGSTARLSVWHRSLIHPEVPPIAFDTSNLEEESEA